MNASSVPTLQDFIYIVSHDLRAPVRHVTQFSDLLIETIDELSEEQRQYVDFIQSSSTKCNNMLESLLTLSRLFTAQITLQEIDVEQIVKGFCTESQTLYSKDYELNISGRLSTPLAMDADHASTLFNCLIDNCFKFSLEESPVSINLALSESPDHQVITISDKGIGIPDSFQPFCRTIFKQASPETRGEGMGLAYVDAICNVYNADLLINQDIAEYDASNYCTSIQIRFPKK